MCCRTAPAPRPCARFTRVPCRCVRLMSSVVVLQPVIAGHQALSGQHSQARAANQVRHELSSTHQLDPQMQHCSIPAKAQQQHSCCSCVPMCSTLASQACPMRFLGKHADSTAASAATANHMRCCGPLLLLSALRAARLWCAVRSCCCCLP